MNKEYTPEEIKNRLSNIGEAIGNIALDYIAELEKENTELKKQLENRSCSNCRRNNRSCPNDGSCHNFSLWQPFKNSKL